LATHGRRTRYAQSGEVYIAYQISGQDGPDLLAAPGFISHLEHTWEEPNAARFQHALGAFSRLICFDKRGTGLCDRSVGVPHLDERMDDIRAALDASGSKRAFLLGISEGGPMSILFAATYPDRVTGVILFGTYARSVGPQSPRTIQWPVNRRSVRIVRRAGASRALLG
jgi:pimeloyl-ACP methyl ester carboxylesterase